MRNMTALDATGLHALAMFAGQLHKSGRTMLLCGARDSRENCLRNRTFWLTWEGGTCCRISTPALSAPRRWQRVSAG